MGSARRSSRRRSARAEYVPLHAAKIPGQGAIRDFCKAFYKTRLADAMKHPVGMVAPQNAVGCAPCCDGVVLAKIVNMVANVTYVSTEFPAVILHFVLYGFSIAVLIFASGKYVINGTRVDSQLVYVTLLVQQMLLECGATGRQNFCCVCPVLNRVFCGHVNVDIDLARVADSVRDVHWRPYTFPSANYFIPTIVSYSGQPTALLLLVWYHFATGMEVDDEDMMLTSCGKPEMKPRGKSRPLPLSSARGVGRPAIRTHACAMLTNSIDTLKLPTVPVAQGGFPGNGGSGDGAGGGGGAGGGKGLANENMFENSKRPGWSSTNSLVSAKDAQNRLHGITLQNQNAIDVHLRRITRSNVSEELDRRTKTIFSKAGWTNLLRCPSLKQAERDFIYFTCLLELFATDPTTVQAPCVRHRQSLRAWEQAFEHPQRVNLAATPLIGDLDPPAIVVDPLQGWREAFNVMPPPLEDLPPLHVPEVETCRVRMDAARESLPEQVSVEYRRLYFGEGAEVANTRRRETVPVTATRAAEYTNTVTVTRRPAAAPVRTRIAWR